jgi:hypothetical protein
VALGRRKHDDEQPPAPIASADVDRQVDEGMLVVAAALRMSAKNRLIVGVLRDRGSYDEGGLADAVRDEIDALIAEKEQTAERLIAVVARASNRRGDALHQSDYRRADAGAIELRRSIELALAERLRATRDDDAAIEAIVDQARGSAMEEMFRPRYLASSPNELEHDYAERRDERMGLLADDLALLLEHPAGGPPEPPLIEVPAKRSWWRTFFSWE